MSTGIGLDVLSSAPIKAACLPLLKHLLPPPHTTLKQGKKQVLTVGVSSMPIIAPVSYWGLNSCFSEN